jgi:cytochrome b
VSKKIRVWDLPTRVFHWALAASVIGLIATGLTGGNWIIWHERIGFCVLALLLFRVIWGVIGSETSRFSDFLRGPRALITYLKTGISPTQGHSPLGGLSVIALLGLLLVQATTGLFVDDDIANKGPLADKVSGAWVALATKVHRLNKWVLGAMVLLHVCAIIFYTYKKKQKLVGPMISGEREVSEAESAPQVKQGIAPWIVLAVCAAFVYWLVNIFPK